MTTPNRFKTAVVFGCWLLIVAAASSLLARPFVDVTIAGGQKHEVRFTTGKVICRKRLLVSLVGPVVVGDDHRPATQNPSCQVDGS